jgi:predicted Fe-Mo cluster-binding NifX family protein
MIKIAAVSDDGQNISRHFGRATKYVVVTIENGLVTGREVRDKISHRDFQGEASLQISEAREEYHALELEEHDDDDAQDGSDGRGFGQKAAARHQRMLDTIADCEIVLAGGMGQGLYEAMKAQTIYPILTEILNIDQAVQAIINDTITNRLDRLH